MRLNLLCVPRARCPLCTILREVPRGAPYDSRSSPLGSAGAIVRVTPQALAILARVLSVGLPSACSTELIFPCLMQVRPARSRWLRPAACLASLSALARALYASRSIPLLPKVRLSRRGVSFDP